MEKIVLLTFMTFVLLCVIPTMALDTGSISVISNPPGAQIWIDKNLQNSVTPHTFDGLAVGMHHVVVDLNGYFYYWPENEKEYVWVTSGQTTTVEFQFEPYPKTGMEIESSTTNTVTRQGDFVYFLITFMPDRFILVQIVKV